MRIVVITLEETYLQALERAVALVRERQGLALDVPVYVASQLERAEGRAAATRDLARADAVFVSMLYFDEHARPAAELLSATANPRLQVAVINSSPDLLAHTRLGKLRLDKDGGLLGQLMTRGRNTPEPGANGATPKAAGPPAARMLQVMRALPRLLRYVPGPAQDLRRYILLMQYWLNGTPENLAGLLRTLAAYYGPPGNRALARRQPIPDPVLLPPVALFHPDAPAPFASLVAYRRWRAVAGLPGGDAGRVGLIGLRSTIITGNTAHSDALIRAIDAAGLEPIPAYAAGLDMRPALRLVSGQTAGGEEATGPGDAPDVLINLNGFPTVGGMAQPQPQAAEKALAALDRPLLSALPLNFQSLDSWQMSRTGLHPVQIALQVAVPELEGAIEPHVYGGVPASGPRAFVPIPANVERLAARAGRMARLRRKAPGERRLALVVFNFPPGQGAVGSAAYLAVFPSLYRLLGRLQAAGYQVDLPPDADALRTDLIEGNREEFGTPAHVAGVVSAGEYRRLVPGYQTLEAQWGPAPGQINSDGQRLFILGRAYGNLFIGVQPPFGFEGDPMRLLMAEGQTPHHGFAGFYAWLDQVWGADALVHVGTHGALEFLPGKQVGLHAADDWPARLIGALPHFYIYSANNPSEGSIARRRSYATLLSYLSPPMEQAGLYQGLAALKESLRAVYAGRDAGDALGKPVTTADPILAAIAAQAADLHLTWPQPPPATPTALSEALAHLYGALLEVEQRLIPTGLHILGEAPPRAELADLLATVAGYVRPEHGLPGLPDLIAGGLARERAGSPDADPAHARLLVEEQVQQVARQAMSLLLERGPGAAGSWLDQTAGVTTEASGPLLTWLEALAGQIDGEAELRSTLAALDGGFVRPAPGADIVRNPAVVPTGRNIHGMDPYALPTPVAQATARATVQELLAAAERENGRMPEAVALVLWGSDNLKTGGEGIAQALELVGAEPLTDALGRVSDVRLRPLADLGRPRIDVILTCSGIFRDLLPNQMALLDRALRLAASADEPPERNFVRRHALALQATGATDAAGAATRVFSNAPGAYGANVNFLVESGAWSEAQALSDTFLARKSFAYGSELEGTAARALMEAVLRPVEVTFQNMDSIETGISDIDHYFEYLGGVTATVERLRGTRPSAWVNDVQGQAGRVRSLPEIIALDSRAKLLNPKWIDGMLRHEYEGVREIGVRVANTLGWSATTDAVPGWVYDGMAEQYVLDNERRTRMTAANPAAYQTLVGKLLEARGRSYWAPSPAVAAELQRVYGELEDLIEAV